MHLWVTYNRLLLDCFLIIHMLCYPLTSSYIEMLLPLRLFFSSFFPAPHLLPKLSPARYEGLPLLPLL